MVGLLHFSTDDVARGQRLAQWQDVVGRTLTGCNSSPLPDGEFRVDFDFLDGGQARLAKCGARAVRNNRDTDCLRDGDEDYIFFLMLAGEGHVDHGGHRSVMRPGDGVLANFSQTLDTFWPEGSVMLIRLAKELMPTLDPVRDVGRLHRRTDDGMDLLRAYARAHWRNGMRSGNLGPLAERHLAELVAATCAGAAPASRVAVSAGRLAAMREVMAGHYADGGLTMRHVAAAVGLSERSGYLAFEGADASFTAELNNLRLSKAAERLLSANDRIMDVAYAVGFADLSYFHRLFRRRFGCTPAEYRDGQDLES